MTSTLRASQAVAVTGGVDTHKDTHTAAAVDAAGRVLGTRQFRADAAGYRALLAWLRTFGTLVLVGIEGTGVYGAGLARFLSEQGVAMVEVDRPDRKARRWQGKSDPVDAEAAARAALARVRTGVPKQRDGRVEALRSLRVARRSAVAQRADAQRQIKALLVTAAESLRTASARTDRPAADRGLRWAAPGPAARRGPAGGRQDRAALPRQAPPGAHHRDR